MQSLQAYERRLLHGSTGIPVQLSYSCLMQDEPELAVGFSRKMSLKGKDGMLVLIISMDDTEATSLEQIQAFLAGSGEVRFAGQRREEVYGWIETTLVRLQYASLDKPGKGLVRRYTARMTGLSRAGRDTQAMEQGVYLFDEKAHSLKPVVAGDHRAKAGTQAGSPRRPFPPLARSLFAGIA